MGIGGLIGSTFGMRGLGGTGRVRGLRTSVFSVCLEALLDSGKLDVSPAITHILDFSDYDHGMQLMRDGACGKVVFRL